jgi:hypothetical protein
LIGEAEQVLGKFAFVDVLENPNLERRLQLWTGRPIMQHRLNATLSPPAGLRTALHQELTSQAHILLESRSRLDLRLWTYIAERCLPGRNPSALRNEVLLTNMARFAVIALAAA